MTTPNEVPELIATVLIAIPSIAILGRLFWIMGEEVWSCHGWKLFKHPNLKPGLRVSLTGGGRFQPYFGKSATILRRAYSNVWFVQVDGIPEAFYAYDSEIEVLPCPKAYEELFL